MRVLILSSLVIARVFKNWISKPGTVVGHTGRAIVITYFGCAVYLTLLNLGFEIEGLRRGVTETFRDWWPRYFWGTVLATCAFELRVR